ncbi:hypothetical protein JG688_00015580 [Phytophthora aleatoria]|uniref:Uncharacterized protein n=1 Tax=Phytophthora aleatoria TaxID=2496075 RepID=A0A8J5I9V3_9STRA|nr:hypothetical protein JG688_00015580 [Phytophthora aleatoria]
MSKYSFEVRMLRLKSTVASDYFVSSFNAEHNGCTGLEQQLQSLTGALIITAVLLHYGIPDSIAHAPTTSTPSTL